MKPFLPFARRRVLRALRDRSGITIVEFGIMAPTFIVLLMGMLDVGQLAYARVLLNGAITEAARNATMETADLAYIDALVESRVKPIVTDVNVEAKRVSYYDFTDIGRPEKWNDKNKNGTCDNGETFTDENGNGGWDPDVGEEGNGGANDAVLYTVTANYRSNFPVPFMPEGWANRQLVAKAVRKNQPYANQASYGTSAGACS
ncbi:MAG: pilus assembly protein [Novosphingobium sp.]|nr:pilus assembly protein [Novosphingobium sp.]